MFFIENKFDKESGDYLINIDINKIIQSKKINL